MKVLGDCIKYGLSHVGNANEGTPNECPGQSLIGTTPLN